jgi:hypothetical protein
MSTDKTLADVQPGGRVRLGDGLPELPPEVDAVRCMIRGEGVMAEACDYYYTAEQMHDYARAALSAQPSPGGQDAQRIVVRVPGVGQCTLTVNDGAVEIPAETIAGLAARQPVGEPEPYVVGNQYFTQAGYLVRFVAVHNEGTSYECMEDEAGVNRYTRRDFGRVTGSAHDYSDPRNTPPLYAVPPTQAVDLDELRRAVCVVGVVGQIDGHDVVRRNSVLDVIDTRRQRLTESKVVGNDR